MLLKTQSLPPAVLQIIQDKATESPFTGAYTDSMTDGTYLCRRCGLALFRAHNKFHSTCGWPSFDKEIAGKVISQPDLDGRRTEIICGRCEAHLGHIFQGEGWTAENTRYCVNSASLDFVTATTVIDTEEAIFAAGCFWGVEYYFQQLPGVLKTEVGYSGGHKNYPTYEEVCTGTTGHVEALRVLYDPQKIDFAQLTRFFFEIHDPTQSNGQGPDRGSQYQSVIFYYDTLQQQSAQKLINLLQQQQGLVVTTRLLPVSVFWQAENYHQQYYIKAGKQPYCHRYTKRFDSF